MGANASAWKWRGVDTKASDGHSAPHTDPGGDPHRPRANDRPAPSPPPARDRAEEGGRSRRRARRHRQARNRPHLPPLLRTHLLERGVDIRTIQELLRHVSTRPRWPTPTSCIAGPWACGVCWAISRATDGMGRSSSGGPGSHRGGLHSPRRSADPPIHPHPMPTEGRVVTRPPLPATTSLRYPDPSLVHRSV